MPYLPNLVMQWWGASTFSMCLSKGVGTMKSSRFKFDIFQVFQWKSEQSLWNDYWRAVIAFFFSKSISCLSFEFLFSLSASAMFIGLLVGFASMGWLMDNLGRKETAVYLRSVINSNAQKFCITTVALPVYLLSVKESRRNLAIIYDMVIVMCENVFSWITIPLVNEQV